MSAEQISLLGIFVAIAIFIYGVFKGYHITIISIVGVAIVALFSQADIVTSLNDIWIGKFAGTYKSYFLMFFFSALFAKSLGDTGAANAIAFKLAKVARMWPGHEKLMAVLCLVLIQAVFSYGGISVFVVTFTVMFIAKELFTELDVPWKLYTCSTLGSSTVTVGMLPGSPQLTNLIPMEYYGTTPTAAPVLGSICALITVFLGVMWIDHQVKGCVKNNEGFEPSGTPLLQSWDNSKKVEKVDIPLWKCLFPSVVLLIALNAFHLAPFLALICATVASYILFNPIKQWSNIKNAFFISVQNANQALVALASAAGFGGMVASVAGFSYIIGALDALPGSPAFQIAISTNVAAAMAASSSTGLKMSLDMLSDQFMDTGIPPAALHRLSAISSICLDDLPHSPALANVYYMCRLDYKKSYINNFMISIVITSFVTIIACILVSLGLTF